MQLPRTVVLLLAASCLSGCDIRRWVDDVPEEARSAVSVARAHWQAECSDCSFNNHIWVVRDGDRPGNVHATPLRRQVVDDTVPQEGAFAGVGEWEVDLIGERAGGFRVVDWQVGGFPGCSQRVVIRKDTLAIVDETGFCDAELRD